MTETNTAEPVADDDQKTIYLGLAMSGAISAGAYSAGVLDFLVEALSEWEKAKDAEKDLRTEDRTVPRHRVVLAVMTGASAGAITSSIGSLAAGKGARPSGPLDDTSTATHVARGAKPEAGKIPWHVLPELYTAWVDGPAFVKKPGDTTGVPGLLDTGDLTKVTQIGSVRSLLNAEPLMKIGEIALNSLEAVPAARPPYIAGKLSIFLTQTNTRGIPYKIQVQGGAGSSIYGMMNHLDHAHFTIKGLGSADFGSAWAAADASYDYTVTGPSTDPASLWFKDSASGTKPNCERFIKNTLASGAFPVGLSAIDLEHPVAFYDKRAWPLALAPSLFADIRPQWPWSGLTVTAPTGYRFAAVDGGAINNDPFDLARYALMDDPPTPSAADVANVDRIVLMVSPFPEAPGIDGLETDGKPNTALSKVAAKLVSMFVEQSRFRPDLLLRSASNSDADLWRVSPTRYSIVNGKERREDAAIACGLWGGFGGFLDIEFRRHDYELGRRNCQRFLEQWFGLPRSNPHIDPTGAPLPNLMATGIAGQEVRYPIIPLCGTARRPVEARDWPTVSTGDYDAFLDAVMTRANRLLEILVAQLKRSFGSWIGWADPLIDWLLGGRDKIRSLVRDYSFGDLVTRDQILAETQRLVLECCLPTAPTRYIVAKRIARDTPKLSGLVQQISDAIDGLLSLPVEVLAQNICKSLERAHPDCGVLEQTVTSATATPSPVYRTARDILAELRANAATAKAMAKAKDGAKGEADVEVDAAALPPDEDAVTRIADDLVRLGYLAVEEWVNVDGGKPKKASWYSRGTRTKGYRYVDRKDGDTLDI
ncbi:hypothetical protein [Azospirillum thermophilum]|uniref:PNPLA domain-containing protein n=1 Tax=Azospirillum thermophilum TaxID=2202148 RepID=A0A2S2CV57_9PROT|nr:hypothetical protein [Azospirillum thermophilum]AWK88167.1 hypothetical protein DEW08_18775 [Azospirillum thermophilum]